MEHVHRPAEPNHRSQSGPFGNVIPSAATIPTRTSRNVMEPSPARVGFIVRWAVEFIMMHGSGWANLPVLERNIDITK
jgi:hypothetical protein